MSSNRASIICVPDSAGRVSCVGTGLWEQSGLAPFQMAGKLLSLLHPHPFISPFSGRTVLLGFQKERLFFPKNPWMAWGGSNELVTIIH